MKLIDEKSISKKEFITVRFFYEKVRNNFNLKLLSDESGLEKKITDRNIHRPGLALAGFVELFTFARVQVFGNTEITYLKNLSEEERVKSLTKIFRFDIPCIILSNNIDPFPEMLALSNQYNIPIFNTHLATTKLIYFISDFLEDQFALRAAVHASFVDVYGVGVLFVGRSGIGKSEVALDLIERGHRLVADDVIIITKKGPGILIGTGTELVKHFMEIRGLGLIDIAKMFGIRAIRFQKRLEVIVELENWDKDSDYTRTGLDERNTTILDVEIPHVKLPIIPGKNITVISEVIALHYLLKHYGYDAAKVFQRRLEASISNKSNNMERGVDYFEHDFE
ncbi:MAG: HPr kinase/phosphorylase [Chlorobiaceae bacterium]|nr:HPr kinase/phosphorylase [Chlorobiaceae bacterium]MBA4308752.1 HPr kinase/phosphorylase [Chlorobiaceae bacterium]